MIVGSEQEAVAEAEEAGEEGGGGQYEHNNSLHYRFHSQCCSSCEQRDFVCGLLVWGAAYT